MVDYDNQPGFAIDANAKQAYQSDIETLIGSLSNYENVIELGCGSGVFTQFLMSNVQRIVGADKNTNQFKKRLPDVRFIHADFTSQQFIDEMIEREQSFDLIITRYVIHELVDPIETFLLWKSLLSYGGRMLLIENTWIRDDWGWDDWGQRTDDLPLACTQTWATGAYCLRKAGFTVSKCEWMHSVNQLESTRQKTGFRLYAIVAEADTDSD
ncbi:MAG: class I SAM-dependent methyltransferase [Chloroflexota bacterium]